MSFATTVAVYLKFHLGHKSLTNQSRHQQTLVTLTSELQQLILAHL